MVSAPEAKIGDKHALLGLVKVSGQPRQLTLTSGGTVVLSTNQVSGVLQGWKVASLP